MKTRKQYLNNECSHREYYSQFVSESMINTVVSSIGLDKLKEAYKENQSFNTIGLSVWDSLAFNKCQANQTLKSNLKECGDFYTMAGGVCIMKEAAKQAIEQ